MLVGIAAAQGQSLGLRGAGPSSLRREGGGGGRRRAAPAPIKVLAVLSPAVGSGTRSQEFQGHGESSPHGGDRDAPVRGSGGKGEGIPGRNFLCKGLKPAVSPRLPVQPFPILTVN